MLAMHPEGNIEALAAIKSLTGVNIRLQSLDEIVEIQSIEDGIQVWIMTHRIQERKADWKVTAMGWKIITLTQSLARVWMSETRTGWDREQCMQEMMDAVRRGQVDRAQFWQKVHERLPEGTFEPFFISHYGPGKSVREWIDGVRHERMAGRVGTSTFPMDTYTRASEGYVHPRMAKHWR